MSGRGALRRLAAVLAALALALGLWQGTIWVFGLPPYVIPSPGAAGAAIAAHWARLRGLAWQTIAETGWGYLAGAALGFALAVAMGQVRLVRDLLYPILITSQAVPIVAVAAPLVIVFGFGLTPKLIIVAWIVFFPVVVNVLDGLAAVDADMINLARVMGAGRWRSFLIVRLPATISPLFSGLKIGATYAVTGAVIGEWTASSSEGLGTYLLSANARLDIAGVYAAMLLLTAIGIVSFVLVQGLEVLLTPWRHRATAPFWWRGERGRTIDRANPGPAPGGDPAGGGR